MKMQYPNLLQATKTHRNRFMLVKAIIICMITIACVLACSTAAKADDIAIIYTDEYTERLDKQKTEVGIAPGAEVVENPYQTIPITDEEFKELRWVLALEAQTEGLEGEIACCEVIFNRVLSNSDWGDTVHEVLSKKGQFTTYKLIGSKRAWTAPGELEDDAISECLRRGLSILPDMTYVYFDTGRKNGKRNIKIGNHWFGAER